MRTTTGLKGEKIMKNGKALLISALVLLGLSSSQVAEPAGQAGGVPALANRLGALETVVANQGEAGTALQLTVDDLQLQLDTVQNDLATLELRLPLFAVVDGDGTLRASRGVQSAGHSLDGSGNPLPGHYRVVFTRNVSLCAATVTAEPLSSSQVTASINGTHRGSPIHSPDVLIIVLFDKDNDLVDRRFNVIVAC
jgi:hypothetical protein